MVDFWEVFGRVLTNDNFKKEIYTLCEAKPYDQKPFEDLPNLGLNIPAQHYEDARAVVCKYIMDGPVSLSTLGELRMIMTSAKFRGLADVLVASIKTSGAKTSGHSKLFYTALGCMLLDENVAFAFANGLFDSYQYGGLTQSERMVLFDLAQPGEVMDKALQACEVFWGTACIDFQLSYPNHLHPIVQAYPPS